MPGSTTTIEPADLARSAAEERLFSPVQLGPYVLPHRVAMAPLTRSRARSPGNVPTALNACYYQQRASAAVIIAEATQVSMQGQGYAWTPGIHDLDQVEGWQLVTEAVQQKGGRIVLQLWHVGRISHPALQPDRMLPVAPSAIKPAGQAFIENEMGVGAMVPFVTPRALDTEEIPYLIQQYVRGAKNAREAGFNGVEAHSANGYLLDQFINPTTNRRTDAYGGPVENRARLLLEVVEAVSQVWGADRVGVRLSPLGTFNDMGADPDPEDTFGYIARKLNDAGLAYIHVINPAVPALEQGIELPAPARSMLEMIRRTYKGTLMIAGGFSHDTAESWLREGRADVIAFGRKFIANADLPERFRENAPLNRDDPTTYYGGGAEGYIDYPYRDGRKDVEPCVDDRWR
jgi:N-ethylmaleimide reductase